MRAASRFNRNRHGARRTILRHRGRGWMRPFQPVESFYQEKDRASDDDEINHKRNEVSVVPGNRPGFHGIGRCGEKAPARRMFKNQKLVEKSSPPVISPIGGMMMSLTSELTIPLKAAPMMTPIARSKALPLAANSLNSFHMADSSLISSRRC